MMIIISCQGYEPVIPYVLWNYLPLIDPPAPFHVSTEERNK